MLKNRHRGFQVVSGLAALVMLAAASGCTGFFVNPVLTSIAVGPTATVQQGATVQESAIGSYNDGSTKTLSSGVQWSSSSDSIATVSSAGLVTGTSVGQATITAAYQATSGTASITVSLGNVTSLKIAPTTASVAINGSQTFNALATVTGQSGTVDVSSTATWKVSDPNNFTITLPTTQGDPVTITAGSGATHGQIVTVTATYQSSSTLTATATLTVQ